MSGKCDIDSWLETVKECGVLPERDLRMLTTQFRHAPALRLRCKLPLRESEREAPGKEARPAGSGLAGYRCCCALPGGGCRSRGRAGAARAGSSKNKFPKIL